MIRHAAICTVYGRDLSGFGTSLLRDYSRVGTVLYSTGTYSTILCLFLPQPKS